MIREKTLKTGEVLADMSQFSVESGRLSIEKQYEKLIKERGILKQRKLELEKIICQNKVKNPSGRLIAGQHIKRNEIIDELTEIQARLMQIKPNIDKLRHQIFRDTEVILEEILVVLKQIARAIIK